MFSILDRHLFFSDPCRRWEGGDPGVANQKSPTCLLLTPDLRFHSFGFAARDFYHDLDPEEARHWLYFDKFKMKIHSTSVSQLYRISRGKVSQSTFSEKKTITLYKIWTVELRGLLRCFSSCICCRTSPWRRSWRRLMVGRSGPLRCLLMPFAFSGNTL